MNDSSKALLISHARRIWGWDAERAAALKRALHHREKIEGKSVEFYSCERCGKVVPRKEKEVDHITPVWHFDAAFKGWDDFYSRLFCAASELSVLCKPCHKNKTQSENVVRRAYKAEDK